VGRAAETDVRDVRATIQQTFYRNGQLRESVPVRNGHRHGVIRVWHKNGKPRLRRTLRRRFACTASAVKWSEAGRLLGKYRMVQGTGLQRAWHDNGKPQMELSTVRGEFCGRSRSWLSDGTHLSDDIYLRGKLVSADKYRAAAAKDKSLPKLGRMAKAVKPVSEKHIHRVFVAGLLAKPNRFEARAWLESGRGDKKARSLGRFKRESDAAKFVAALYDAGATEVIAPDVYRGKKGDEFADALLVRLPNSPAKRKAIRTFCTQLQKRKLGAVQPDMDIGETHLFLSLA
jgi:hypothetical protein